ncbi:hypothetical protein DEEACLCL_00183 [Salmonella phage CRW-SP2]|nr:hypothetical protein DEEACLCL_00183 [Salmonella phage CRW-SP2]
MPKNPPKGATVILRHQDGRIFYAERFEQGATFWDDTGNNPRTLQGIIHKLEVVAERIGNDEADTWIWGDGKPREPVSTPAPVKPPVMSKKERMAAEQQTLKRVIKKDTNIERIDPVRPAKKEMKSDLTPPVVDTRTILVREERVLVDPVETKKVSHVVPVVSSPVVSESVDEEEFVSLRGLRYKTSAKTKQGAVTIHRAGKLSLNKVIREAIGKGGSFAMKTSRDYKRFMIQPGGEGYILNQNGMYTNKYFTEKVEHAIPVDHPSKVFDLNWDDNLKAFIGEIV